MPELCPDQEEGGGGVDQSVGVHTRHDRQHCLIAGHVGPAVECPVRQGQLGERGRGGEGERGRGGEGERGRGGEGARGRGGEGERLRAQ